MISPATCAVCDSRTERRELPSRAGVVGIDVKKVVSYWCPECRRWEATDEAATDAPPFLDRMAKVPAIETV
jgi:hypothetical protein